MSYHNQIATTFLDLRFGISDIDIDSCHAPWKLDPPSVALTTAVIKKNSQRSVLGLPGHVAQMAKQFRRLRRGLNRILGALCLRRAPRSSDRDPEKPVYSQVVPSTSKPSIDGTTVVQDPTYPHPFPLLQLPVELQLEVIDCIYDLSQESDNSAKADPLLNLRLYVLT